MNVKKMNLRAWALLLVVLGSGCATAQRASTIQVVTPPTDDQANVSATGAGRASAVAPPAKTGHVSGMGVPNWWQTDALQSGDVMGTM